jgi:hypothetical protein
MKPYCVACPALAGNPGGLLFKSNFGQILHLCFANQINNDDNLYFPPERHQCERTAASENGCFAEVL